VRLFWPPASLPRTVRSTLVPVTGLGFPAAGWATVGALGASGGLVNVHVDICTSLVSAPSAPVKPTHAPSPPMTCGMFTV